MKRREFIRSVAATVAQLGIAGYVSSNNAQEPLGRKLMEVKLAGVSFKELRQSLYNELINVFVPFWDQHGVDHEHGGFMSSMDYDGTLVNSDKLLWFQGRGIWIYSFMYNHIDRNPKYLETARQTMDFVMKHALQADGWWAEKLSREGKVLKPYSGDTEGMYFIVEGFQEYAAATGDKQARDLSFALLKDRKSTRLHP